MSKNGGRPGRPSANRAVYDLRGTVEEPDVAGNVAEVLLPSPKNFKTIVAALHSMGAFEITFEFSRDAMHIYAATARAHHADPASAPPSLLVTVPADATCHTFVAGDSVVVGVSRVDVEKATSNISSRHEHVRLGVDGLRKFMQVDLMLHGQTTSFSCAIIPADSFSPASLPHEPFRDGPAPDTDAVHYSSSVSFSRPALTSLLENFSSAMFIGRVVIDIAEPLGFQYQMPTKVTSAAPPKSLIPPDQMELDIDAGETAVHASFMCSVFVVLRYLVTAHHEVTFFIDNHNPIVVTGCGGDDASLLARTYFRIEAPACGNM